MLAHSLSFMISFCCYYDFRPVSAGNAESEKNVLMSVITPQATARKHAGKQARQRVPFREEREVVVGSGVWQSFDNTPPHLRSFTHTFSDAI